MRGRYFNHHYNFQYAWQQDQSKPMEVCNIQEFQRSGLGNTASLQSLGWDSKTMHEVNPLDKGNTT